MAAYWVVEVLDVVEHIGSGFVASAVELAGSELGLQRGKEPLIAELPHKLPVLLIEQVIPLSASRRGTRAGVDRSWQHART